MKFLKTFLFAISLCFISFGVVTLKGFCASVALDPSLSPSVNSNINQFSSFAVTPEYMAIYGPAYLDELNTQLYQSYGWDLETLSWYGEDRFKGYMFGQEQNPLNSTDLTPTIANAISNRMLSGTIETIVTAKSLYDTGYNYFCTAVPQWGNNAKQWILGKVDSVSGKISEVGSNTVTKITSEGLSNYLSIYNDMVSSGQIDSVDSFGPIYSDVFNSTHTLSNQKYVQLKFDVPVLSFVWSTSLNFCIPESALTLTNNNYYLNSYSGFYINSNGSYRNFVTAPYISNGTSISINGISYIYGNLYYDGAIINYYNSNLGNVINNPSYGNTSNISTFLNYFYSNYTDSVALSYDYSSNWVSSIQDQLDRLIGKYVDSVSLKRIKDIVDSIPIGKENDIPVAIPTQSIVDSLTAVVDEAVELDPDYSAVFGDADAVVIEPEPEPAPSGDYGLVIPDDFPIDTVSPILDSVYLPSHFFSIFEPLFGVFGQHQTLLLNSWYVIPSFLIVLALFGLVL